MVLLYAQPALAKVFTGSLLVILDTMNQLIKRDYQRFRKIIKITNVSHKTGGFSCFRYWYLSVLQL